MRMAKALIAWEKENLIADWLPECVIQRYLLEPGASKELNPELEVSTAI